jgi:hypothetical protein
MAGGLQIRRIPGENRAINITAESAAFEKLEATKVFRRWNTHRPSEVTPMVRASPASVANMASSTFFGSTSMPSTLTHQRANWSESGNPRKQNRRLRFSFP